MIKAKVLIAASKIDEAGMNIISCLKDIIQFQPANFVIPSEWKEGEYELFSANNCSLLIMSNPHYEADYLSIGIDAELVIFASKHLSKAGQKAILVHSLGNWNESRNNSGKDQSLAISSPKAIYQGYHSLLKFKTKENLDNYWVGIEATHHGPTELQVPVIFFEVGGTIEEWKDKKAAFVVARAIVETIEIYKLVDVPIAIGIGGTHYDRAFIERMEAKLFAISHIMPKYVMSSQNKEIIKQAWDKTPGDDKQFLIDKSGTRGKERSELIDILEGLTYPYSMTSDHPIND